MENLSELVTSYSTLDGNQEPASNQLEEVANTQVPPLPPEASDNQTPPELPTSYQAQNPTKRISRRGLIAGGIISGLAILLYKGCNDGATNAKVTNTKRKTKEERKRELEKRRSEEQREIYARQEREKRELEEKEDIEMHKLTDSEFAEYLELYRKSYKERSEEENRRFSALERKIDAIKKSPSKALSLMDNSTRREYEAFKRNQEEFNAYFSRIKEEYDKNLSSRSILGEIVLAPIDFPIQGFAGLLGLDSDYVGFGDCRKPSKKKEDRKMSDYISEYNKYDSEYRGLTCPRSNSDKDLILYFYYTRHKGGMFIKRME